MNRIALRGHPLKKFKTGNITWERRTKMRKRMHWLLGAALFAMIAGDRLPPPGRNRWSKPTYLATG